MIGLRQLSLSRKLRHATDTALTSIPYSGKARLNYRSLHRDGIRIDNRTSGNEAQSQRCRRRASRTTHPSISLRYVTFAFSPGSLGPSSCRCSSSQRLLTQAAPAFQTSLSRRSRSLCLILRRHFGPRSLGYIIPDTYCSVVVVTRRD